MIQPPSKAATIPPPRRRAALGLIFVYLVTVLTPHPSTAAPTKNPIACVAKKNGAITIKSKCTRSETRLAESSYSEGRTSILNVAPSGAKYNSISAAITAGLSLAPSATNPLVIRMAPGTYTESSSIVVPQFTTIDGAGAGASILALGSSGGLVLSEAAHLRKLTIESAMPITVGAAVEIPADSRNVTIEDAAFILRNPSQGSLGIASSGANVHVRNVAVENTARGDSTVSLSANGGSITLEDMRIKLQGPSSGLQLLNATQARVVGTMIDLQPVNSSEVLHGFRIGHSGTKADIDGVQVRIAGTAETSQVGIYASNPCSVSVRNSFFSLTGLTYGAIQGDDGATLTVLNSDIITDTGERTAGAYTGGSVSIAGSRLSGGPVFAQLGSTARCAGVSDENFTFSASECP